jgi:hypothetical protein
MERAVPSGPRTRIRDQGWRRGEVADGEARERRAESIEGPIDALRVRELGPDCRRSSETA